jgi:hypothetical protein
VSTDDSITTGTRVNDVLTVADTERDEGTQPAPDDAENSEDEPRETSHFIGDICQHVVVTVGTGCLHGYIAERASCNGHCRHSHDHSALLLLSTGCIPRCRRRRVLLRRVLLWWVLLAGRWVLAGWRVLALWRVRLPWRRVARLAITGRRVVSRRWCRHRSSIFSVR